MKKKVMLILPPNVTVIPPFSTAEKRHQPMLLGFPLGLGYIASYILRQGKYDVCILDANKDELTIPAILDEIKKYNPSFVGITMYTVNSKVTVELARQIKLNLKNIVVVAGGPHASDDYYSLLTRYPFFDYVVIGEGEVTFSELLDAVELKDTTHLSSIKGLAYPDNAGQVIYTGARELHNAIDDFPAPARQLIDFNQYISKDNLLPYAIEIMGSRGCTHRCAFCSFQKKWRPRRTMEIIREMKDLIRTYPQTRSFLFFDDNFSANKQRVMELCQTIIAEGLRSYMWSCLCRADQVDEEMIRAMKSAGCTKIMFGLETADPGILKNLHKKISLTQVKEVVETAAHHGIDALTFFIIGNPGETPATVKTSYNFAKKLKCHSTMWNIMQVYPGTALSRLQPCDDFVGYLYEPEVQQPCNVISANIMAFVNPELNREQLKKMYHKVFRDIVLYKAITHPLFTLKKFFGTPSWAIRFLTSLFR